MSNFSKHKRRLHGDFEPKQLRRGICSCDGGNPIQDAFHSVTDAVDNTFSSAADVVNPGLDSIGLKGAREGLTNAWHDVSPIVDTVAKFTPFAPYAYAYDSYDAGRNYGDTGNLGQLGMAGINGALAGYGMPGTAQTGFANGNVPGTGFMGSAWESAKNITPSSWLNSAPLSEAEFAAADAAQLADQGIGGQQITEMMNQGSPGTVLSLDAPTSNVMMSDAEGLLAKGYSEQEVADQLYNSSMAGGYNTPTGNVSGLDAGLSGSETIPVSTSALGSETSVANYKPIDETSSLLGKPIDVGGVRKWGSLPTISPSTGEAMLPPSQLDSYYGNLVKADTASAFAPTDAAEAARRGLTDSYMYDRTIPQYLGDKAGALKDWMGSPVANTKEALGLGDMSVKDMALMKMMLGNQPYQPKTQGLQALKGGLTAAQAMAVANLALTAGDRAYTKAQNTRATPSGGRGINTAGRIGGQQLRRGYANGGTVTSNASNAGSAGLGGMWGDLFSQAFGPTGIGSGVAAQPIALDAKFSTFMPQESGSGMGGMLDEVYKKGLTQGIQIAATPTIDSWQQPIKKARGGAIPGNSQGALSRYVGGDTGGQDDKIPAQLSSGEYVMDADTVASLGDGNNAAGAKKLDGMRKNIRSHKRSGGLSSIPPKSKAPEQYLKGKK